MSWRPWCFSFDGKTEVGALVGFAKREKKDTGASLSAAMLIYPVVKMLGEDIKVWAGKRIDKFESSAFFVRNCTAEEMEELESELDSLALDASDYLSFMKKKPTIKAESKKKVEQPKFVCPGTCIAASKVLKDLEARKREVNSFKTKMKLQVDDNADLKQELAETKKSFTRREKELKDQLKKSEAMCREKSNEYENVSLEIKHLNMTITDQNNQIRQLTYENKHAPQSHHRFALTPCHIICHTFPNLIVESNGSHDSHKHASHAPTSCIRHAPRTTSTTPSSHVQRV